MKIWSESRLVNIVVVMIGLFLIGDIVEVLTRPPSARIHRTQKSVPGLSGGDRKLYQPTGSTPDGGI